MSQPASPPAAAPAPVLSPPWFIAIVLAQLVGLGWFLRAPLPSVTGATLRRGDLILAADDHLGHAARQFALPGNLAQRVPIVGATLLVAAAATAAGLAILRGLRLSIRLTLAERVALGFGLGSSLLGVATLLLGRGIGLNSGAVRVALGVLVVVGLGVEVWSRWRGGGLRPTDADGPPRWSIRQVLGFAMLVGPFLTLMGLGALLPTIEFDALEYHLQGPKEYFLDGRISFLPHNVYASMPFGVEMLTTLAMEVTGDWWLGALAGQELIAWFAPASAVLIAAAASQVAGSNRAGWFAALVYLTTPWIFRAGGTPFVEGPLCFCHAALIWAVIRLGWFRQRGTGQDGRPLAEGLLVGLLAGGALAIKYPALLSAVIPAGLVVLTRGWQTRSGRLVMGFAVGLGLVAGPWLGKNVVDTGNPVYPLAWSIFGGDEWDATRDARWQGAHGPRPVTIGLLAASMLDVAGRSDWQSPLYAALGPLAWFGVRGRRTAGLLAGYAAYVFLTWWLLTHRLDRFWLPMLPALAVLAGLGADAFGRGSRAGPAWLGLVLAVGIGANFLLCATELCGPTAWTGDLAAVRDETIRTGTPSLARLDDALPPDARPLVIGQAGTFPLRHRPGYSTVFDRDRFEAIVRGRSHVEVSVRLHRRGFTHVYVDWAEIARYRQPGNYGFTNFETPELFDDLVKAGLLGPGVRLGTSQVLYPVR